MVYVRKPRHLNLVKYIKTFPKARKSKTPWKNPDFFFIFFWDRVLCNPGYPPTCCVAEEPDLLSVGLLRGCHCIWFIWCITWDRKQVLIKCPMWWMCWGRGGSLFFFLLLWSAPAFLVWASGSQLLTAIPTSTISGGKNKTKLKALKSQEFPLCN